MAIPERLLGGTAGPGQKMKRLVRLRHESGPINIQSVELRGAGWSLVVPAEVSSSEDETSVNLWFNVPGIPGGHRAVIEIAIDSPQEQLLRVPLTVIVRNLTADPAESVRDQDAGPK